MSKPGGALGAENKVIKHGLWLGEVFRCLYFPRLLSEYFLFDPQTKPSWSYWWVGLAWTLVGEGNKISLGFLFFYLWVSISLADCSAMSFVFVCWRKINIRNTNQLSWAINFYFTGVVHLDDLDVWEELRERQLIFSSSAGCVYFSGVILYTIYTMVLIHLVRLTSGTSLDSDLEWERGGRGGRWAPTETWPGFWIQDQNQDREDLEDNQNPDYEDYDEDDQDEKEDQNVGGGRWAALWSSELGAWLDKRRHWPAFSFLPLPTTIKCRVGSQREYEILFCSRWTFCDKIKSYFNVLQQNKRRPEQTWWNCLWF